MSNKNHTSAANEEVLEAEVISESIDDKIKRGTAYSHSKEPKPSALDEMKQGAVIDQDADVKQEKDSANKNMKSKGRGRFAVMFDHLKKRVLSSAFALLVIGALLYLFAQQQWMQNRFVNIDQDLQTLDKKTVAATNQAKTAQGGVEAIQSSDFATQIAQQQETLQSLQQQLQSVGEQPSAVSPEQLTELEQKLSQQIQQAKQAAPMVSNVGDSQGLQALQDKLSEQIQQLQQAQQQLAEQVRQADKAEGVSPAQLTLVELKQWAVKINAQWLLQAPSEQVQQQLQAFKQATALLPQQLAYSITLLIEQDLAQLSQRQTQMAQAAVPDLSVLRQLVQNLPEPKVEYIKPQQEGEQNQTVWQGLLDKLSGLVKIQKREAESVTQVEALMLHEVIQQRLFMEIDRLDYAMQISSHSLIQAAITNLQQISKAQAPAIAEEIKTKLQPFAQLHYIQRQPLLITKIADAAQS
ncbi:hypothetical protein J3998_10940 [Thiomicrorhabdus sp. 6S2-11]|uniref:Uncharacterized protein n=1 Tax=Thiomicrorhabdus marina TaxID=2818442 RepID=A0ABS3Q6Y5_9GAMM|nr:hypothetical protein [Thiomicrorhabdus marina]MBO1928092.1 hypothetical protein [Thiomicrorhabdus marina]